MIIIECLHWSQSNCDKISGNLLRTIDKDGLLLSPLANRNKSLKANKSKSPTLEDVARVAGLSAMTVSRALNNPSVVKEATLNKVKSAVESTGYIPNKAAGALASSKSGLIGVVVPQINNSMFVETVEALRDHLAQRGYHVLLSVSGFSATSEADIVSALLSHRPDGIVLTGVHHDNRLKKILLNSSVPVVEIWDSTPTPIDMLVGLSHHKIGEAIGLEIVQKQPKHVGLIWAEDARALKRLEEIVRVLKQKNIAFTIVHVLTPATVQSGRQGLLTLLEEKHSFDVIACSSDTLAQGCIAEAHKQNMKVPDDFAVIGFGDLDIAEYNVPSITTVNIDRVGMGQRAANMLADKIEGKLPENPIVNLDFSFKYRESF